MWRLVNVTVRKDFMARPVLAVCIPWTFLSKIKMQVVIGRLNGIFWWVTLKFFLARHPLHS